MYPQADYFNLLIKTEMQAGAILLMFYSQWRWLYML